MYTMGDVARCSIGKPGEYHNEDLLYKLFGVNAELLIDHAWGWEPCTMADIKAYKPSASSIGSGQVLHCPYTVEKARLVVREMAESLALDLVDKHLATDQIILTVGYDRESLSDPGNRESCKGEIKTDRYGRSVPKHAHGTVNLKRQTSSARLIAEGALALYDENVRKDYLVRRIAISANHVVDECTVKNRPVYEQLDLFTDYAALKEEQEAEEAELRRERSLSQAVLDIKKKYGKNAILKGINLMEGATAIDRNQQIGGHRA